MSPHWTAISVLQCSCSSGWWTGRLHSSDKSLFTGIYCRCCKEIRAECVDKRAASGPCSTSRTAVIRMQLCQMSP